MSKDTFWIVTSTNNPNVIARFKGVLLMHRPELGDFLFECDEHIREPLCSARTYAIRWNEDGSEPSLIEYPNLKLHQSWFLYKKSEEGCDCGECGFEIEDETPITAADILEQAYNEVNERAILRDTPEGERSMRAAVRAFNELYGTDLTETQGWVFMAILKISRSSQGGYHPDDFIDLVGYSALAGECAAQESCN